MAINTFAVLLPKTPITSRCLSDKKSVVCICCNQTQTQTQTVSILNPLGYLIQVMIQHQRWHDDVIKWKHLPRYWPFVRGIHRPPVNSPSFDVSFDLCLNKRLRKQSWGGWFETLSRPLWRHCNGWAKIPMVTYQQPTLLSWYESETDESVCLQASSTHHWNGNVLLMKFSSSSAKEVVKPTNSYEASNENSASMASSLKLKVHNFDWLHQRCVGSGDNVVNMTTLAMSGQA